MRSYRFARRSFLASSGGAFGLRILLDDFEAMAQGATSPPRFLMTHWPVGTSKYKFLPNGGAVPQGVGTISEFSSILKPFEAAGLKDDMSLIWGLRDTGSAGGGGGPAGPSWGPAEGSEDSQVTARPRRRGRFSASPPGRPVGQDRAAQSAQVPTISTVCSGSVKPCSALTAAAHRSTAGPSTSTVRPHTRQTRWWWWPLLHCR